MKKAASIFNITVIAALLILFTINTGYAKAKPQPKPGWPKVISAGGSPMGGLWYTEAAAFGDLISRYLGVDVTPEATSGGGENFRHIKGGEMEMACCTSHQVYDGYRGIGIFAKEGKFPVRVCWNLQTSPIPMVARKGSGINTIADLVGKRVEIESVGAPTLPSTWHAVFDKYGVLNKIKLKKLTTSKSQFNSFITGQTDVFLWPTSIYLSSAVWQNLKGKMELQPVRSDLNILKEIQNELPWFTVSKIPKEALKGLDKPWYCPGFASYFVCSKNLPEDFMYEVAKTVYGHRDDLKKVHKIFNLFTMKECLEPPFIAPFHAGVVKYLKEAGLWGEEQEKAQKKVLAETGDAK